MSPETVSRVKSRRGPSAVVPSRLALAAAFALVVTLAGEARAGPPVDPQAVAVDELVVTARAVGPAWWRASRGQSVVWILGVPPQLPKGFKWDTRVLDQHLTGARQVIAPAVATASVFSIPAVFALARRMKTRTPLEDSLPPELRARFLAAVQALHRTPDRYDRWNGFVAALTMIRDFEQAAALDPAAPTPALDRAARAHGLKPRPAATYNALQMLRAGAAEIDPETSRACLAAALDEVAGGRDAADRAAAGWARGEVGVALTASPGADHCLALLPEGARVARQSMADESAAIAGALQQPGVAVAFMPLRRLVAEGGILPQLQAMGVRIQGPNGADLARGEAR